MVSVIIRQRFIRGRPFRSMALRFFATPERVSQFGGL